MQHHLLATDDEDDRPFRIRPPKPRKPQAASLADEEPHPLANATYRMTRFETSWLPESLGPFLEQSLITDVEALVRGGKEATVYRCTPGETLDCRWLAAKVYRPRALRNLRNDAMYREGRGFLTADGRPVKRSDHRIIRAIGKKTTYGVQAQHTSWLMHEFVSLQKMHAAGAPVPKPYAASENAVLMEYVGDENGAATALSQVALDPETARPLLRDILRGIDILAGLGLAHGDLSAYNVLYSDGRAVIIDFPQVVELSGNPHAEEILYRDVLRVCEYFQAQGVKCVVDRIFDRIWATVERPDPAEMGANEGPVVRQPDRARK